MYPISFFVIFVNDLTKLEKNLYKLKFVAKSKEFPNDVKKARNIEFDIFIPPYLMTYYMIFMVEL